MILSPSYSLHNPFYLLLLPLIPLSHRRMYINGRISARAHVNAHACTHIQVYLGRIRYYGSAKHPRRKAGGSNRSLIKPHPRGQDPVYRASFAKSTPDAYLPFVPESAAGISGFGGDRHRSKNSTMPTCGNCAFRMIRSDRFAGETLMDPATRALTL